MIVVLRTDGEVVRVGERLRVSKGNYAEIRVTSATNFLNYHDISGNAQDKAQSAMDNSLKDDYKDDLPKHIEKYGEQYRRASLILPTNQTSTANNTAAHRSSCLQTKLQRRPPTSASRISRNRKTPRSR